MKTFTEYFPKYPKSDELYELVRLSMVKSTLVNKAQRKVKVWLTTQQYMDASVCVRIAANIKEAYTLADVTVRCCCAGAQKSTLADFLQEAKEDNAALGAYLAGEARWEDGVVCVPVRIAGAAVLERVGMVKKLQEGGAKVILTVKFHRDRLSVAAASAAADAIMAAYFTVRVHLL